MKVSQRDGFAEVVLAIVISFMLLTIILFVGMKAQSSVFWSQLELLSSRAQYLAESGIEDALIKIARDKTYNGTYALPQTDGTINISVSGSGPMIISSTATVQKVNNSIIRNITASVTIDADGLITTISRTSE